MSRFKRLRDWPECLKRMRSDELQHELQYWKGRIQYLGHPQAKKVADKRVREIEREVESRV